MPLWITMEKSTIDFQRVYNENEVSVNEENKHKNSLSLANYKETQRIIAGEKLSQNRKGHVVRHKSK